MTANDTHTDDSGLLDGLQEELHLWFSNPDTLTDARLREQYTSLLSAAEMQRYRRFHFESDRTRFLVSHALVRTVLSKYTGTDPAAWQFATNEHGRPEIDRPAGLPPLRFNLTHTAGFCACIITLGLDCGIDAEYLPRSRGLGKIAERMFAAPELASLNACSDINFRQRFFQFWTLREAYVKALGTGLAGSTRDFHFEIGDGDQASIHFAQPSKGDGSHWQFALLRPDSEHIAALAVRRPHLPDRMICTWAITPPAA